MPTQQQMQAATTVDQGPPLPSNVSSGSKYHDAIAGKHKLSRSLKKGASGDDVLILRQALISKGSGGRVPFLNDRGEVIEGFALPSTGSFDSSLEKVVKAFQTKQKLKVDGIVGKNTWKALLGSKAKTVGVVKSTYTKATTQPTVDEETGSINWAKIAIIGGSVSIGIALMYFALRPSKKKNPPARKISTRSNPKRRKRVSSRRVKANRSRVKKSGLRIRRNP